jgi:hypothetical protein
MRTIQSAQVSLPLLSELLCCQEVDFLQFSFRWVNCLLLREIPFSLIPRLWVRQKHILCQGPIYYLQGSSPPGTSHVRVSDPPEWTHT